MMIPSIDLMEGQAVQLVEGRRKVIDAGDPRPIADRFGRIGDVAVIDLDAALGRGSNETVIRELLERAPCRVGGGIRDVKAATRWLDAGARSIILGTAAKPEILRDLPRERVIAALDARQDRVVVEGWTKQTEDHVFDRIDALRDLVGGFLITFVEREGHMCGLEMDRVQALVERAGPVRVTVAGGVRTPEDVGNADRAGADAQVGMALYSGVFDVADGLCASLRSDRSDGLWPTIVADEFGVALGLAYSDIESIRHSIDTGQAAYHSRSRGGLWVKGQTSGHTQQVISISADCDRDCLRMMVRQKGPGFCHRGSRSCFGDDAGMCATARTIEARVAALQTGSYTARLAADPSLLQSKLLEEARELIEASDAAHAAREAADVVYFALVAASVRGASLGDIDRELARRSLLVTRRSGDAKSENDNPKGAE